MSSISLSSLCESAWETVRLKVNKAVVFLDPGSAECLHWAGGGAMLVKAGAVNIKEFSSFVSGSKDQRKAVFILSAPLNGLAATKLKDILQASAFQYVIVISTLSPAMHTLISHGPADDEMRSFHELEDRLLEWMGNTSYTTEVIYQGLGIAPMTPHLFFMPQHKELFPLLPTDIQHLQNVHQKDGSDAIDLDFTHLGREAQLELKLLVCSLNSMMEMLSVSEDCYALGQTSKVVATELAALTWAKTRRKNAQQKASLLLVDRTLDMTSAVSHQTDTLLEKILGVLPRLPGHTVDVKVNMVPVCSVPNNCDPSIICPGCLAHPSDGAATQLLNTLASVKHKEGLMEVNRQLVEAASASSLPLKLSGRPGRVNVDQLKSTVALFKGKSGPVQRYGGLLQLVLATIQTLDDKAIDKLDSLLGVEKGLVSCVGEDDTLQPIQHVTKTVSQDMEKPVTERLYTLEDIFLLLVFIYSLADGEKNIDEQQERILRAAIVGSILEDGQEILPPFLQSILGEKYSEDRVCEVIEEIFSKLRGLSQARDNLTQFRSVCDPGSITSPPMLKSLLKQVTEEIFSAEKAEITDIVYKSTGFRDLLKSGFGLFMKVSKPRPSDYPLLIIFVIGGVTPSEVKQIKDAVNASKTSVQVMVGGTNVLRPQDTLHVLLAQDNLYPETHSL